MFTPIEHAYFILQEYKHNQMKNIRKNNRLYHTYKVYMRGHYRCFFYLLIDDNDEVYITELYDYSEDISNYELYCNLDDLIFKYEQDGIKECAL